MATLDITSFGASPSLPDSTIPIQLALDGAKAGDTVLVPAGTFNVNAERGLYPWSGITLQINGVLQALPTANASYVVVGLSGVSDITVVGTGSIVGERFVHQGPGPARAGMCLGMLNSSNIRVGGGLILTQAWADGLYVQGCTNVTVDHVLCVDNSRNGMSIIAATGLNVSNCTFQGTHSESPMPQSGIDIEPDLPEQSLLDIYISNNQFIKNKGAGCYISFQPAANRARVHVVNNAFDQHYKDGGGPPIGGRNTPMSNLLYTTCRWIPGYDYWAFPTQFEC